MQGPTGFNPGFDRKKESLMQLSNKNGGLDPLDYLYSKSASFQSLIASDIKGGLIDSYMIYTKGLDADIITARYAHIITEDATTINVETINSDHIHNKYEIDTHDLYAYDKIYFGTDSKSSETLIYGSFQLYGGGFDIGSPSSPVSSVLIDSVVMEVAIATVLSIDAVLFNNIVGTQYSLASPLVNINAPVFELNFVERALPIGTVGIYSGSNIYLSAPLVQIGPATIAALTRTLNFNVNVDLGINFNSTGSIDLDSKTTRILATDSIKLESINSVSGEIDVLMEIQNEIDQGFFSLDGKQLKFGARSGIGIPSTEQILMQANIGIITTCGVRPTASAFTLDINSASLSAINITIGETDPSQNLGVTESITLRSIGNVFLTANNIKIQNTAILQPEVQFYTNSFNVNSIGSGIEDKDTSSINLTSDHGITIQNNAPLSTLNIKSTFKDMNISTDSVANINISSNNTVNITGINLVEIKSNNTIGLNSTEVSVSSLNFPTVRVVEGTGVIVPVTGGGDCTFELVNIVICEAGVLKLADITVNVIFA